MPRLFKSRTRKTRVERLERRDLLAITAFVTDGGDLIVRSPTDVANEVAIFQVPLTAPALVVDTNFDADTTDPGDLVLPGDYIVLGGAGTMVNGNPFARFAGGDVYNDIIVDTRNDADTVLLGNLAGITAAAGFPAAAVTAAVGMIDAIETAFGTDLPADALGLTVADDLEIRTRGGDDIVALSGVIVLDNTSIDTGDAPAGDTVVVAGGFFGEDLSIRTGSGADVVTLSDAQIADDLEIRTRGNNDVVTLTAMTVLSNTLIDAGDALPGGIDTVLVFGGAFGEDLTIRTGSGDDFVRIAAIATEEAPPVPVVVGDDLEIYTNGGGDEVLLSDLRIGDDLYVATGSGGSIGVAPAFQQLQVQGVELVAINNVIVADVARINTGGSGLDNDVVQIGLQGPGLKARELRIETGRGTDLVSIARSQIFAKASINTGADDDFLTLGAGNAWYELDVNLDSGNDRLEILALNTVARSANVSGGSGGGDVVTGTSFFANGRRFKKISFRDFETNTLVPAAP